MASPSEAEPPIVAKLSGKEQPEYLNESLGYSERMELRRLRILCQVADQQSLSAAASELSYSVSSVSEQMALLERETGAALLERQPRGVRLTEAGAVLVSHAREILARVATAQAEIDDLSGLRAGSLRMAAFVHAGPLLLSRAVSDFRGRYPSIDLDLVEADPDEAMGLLAERAVDLALVYDFNLGTASSVGGTKVELFADSLSLIVARTHRLASRRSVRMGELATERWIQGVRRGSTLDVLPTVCRAAGFEPDIAFQTDDPMAVQGFVAAGLGVAVMSQLVLPVARNDIVAISLRPAMRRTISATVPTTDNQTPAVTAMLDVLASAAASL